IRKIGIGSLYGTRDITRTDIVDASYNPNMSRLCLSNFISALLEFDCRALIKLSLLFFLKNRKIIMY
ncbi:hypothetical protein PMAYCL1PPCAC_14041, partial [Pristionchus mayeri]